MDERKEGVTVRVVVVREEAVGGRVACRTGAVVVGIVTVITGSADKDDHQGEEMRHVCKPP
jgi:hypothetical protein